MARKQGSHAGITGPKVQDAALRLFAQHGYAAVSMRQIAAEVGVQAGALYNYTADKQSLLFDLLRGNMTELIDALDAAALTGTPLARLDAFTRFHIRFHLPRRDTVFLSYMELRNLTDENFAQIAELRRAYEDRLEDILHDGVASGDFTVPDCRVATLGLIALLTGITNWYRPGGRLTAAEIEANYCTLVCQSVGARLA
ncbi:MAG: AcrR family transcriptional regulator [Loktanella salsilacus]|jgi:AcrR family transcriptional regulator|uniref:Transcriptional regulator, TetR family n=1 Tax=Loktanella salsilacus TaxID=195913 RepID=A0A1I4I3L6_9RHOB|nr:TetR/AcrR family transcriptional regulator [Loktanella salsilacus]MBU0779392.1 TetR/AcrR family transcriptional regulator [Alphaproteobacteria bacterium]SFL48401.1 transcriptional regulator, TetR family [Loktanella salsilacus]|tara:strand:- start:1566 stop:2162 length:597 start_codon:yes stop_codon:yes gene_type:complete